MANFKYTKPVPSIHDLHNEGQRTISEFLNDSSKALGSISNLGKFTDIINIFRDSGIKAEFEYILVERNEFTKESAGRKYEQSPGPDEIFEMDYNLPVSLNSATKAENFVMLSTVETYTCNTSEDCPVCNASGRCSKCIQGYNECRVCRGQGYSDITSGGVKKKEKCWSCNGKGKTKCSTCNGRDICVNCNGSRKIVCRRCEGTGYYQYYKAYSNIYKPVKSNVYYSEYTDLKNALPDAKGVIGFDDKLVEWKNKSNIFIDNRVHSKKTNKFAPKIIAELDNYLNLSPNQKIGSVRVKIETIPITIVEYRFEDKNYQVYIVGSNYVLCYNKVPKKHSYRQNFIKRVLNAFTKRKRKIAFVYIAAYILNADDKITEDEKAILGTFLNHIGLKNEKKSALINELFKSSKLGFEEIVPKISCLRGDKRALIFAWQCVLQDNDVHTAEENAFDNLIKFFKIKENEIATLKQKAKKFARLNDPEMLNEYFK